VRAKMAAKANDPMLLLPQAETDMWFVYAIECEDGSLYIGQTEDLRQRWLQHVSGKGGRWTKTHHPQRVAYWEKQPSREEAVEREKWLKTGFGRKWLKKEIAVIARTQTGVPVRAKTEGRPTGLPDDIAALFPDSFEDSELGEVPKGWTVRTIEDFATLKTQTVQPKSKPEKIWEHYSIPAFDEGKQPVGELGKDIKSGKYTVPRNSVLASKLNPQFPRVWLPDVKDTNSSICSTEFMPFVPVVESWRPYLYEMLKSQTIQSEIISRVTGSTGSRQRVKPREIAVLPCLVPPEKLIDFFCTQVGPSHDNLLSNIRQSATLTSLRDTLLPKLISGELRIPDAEKFVEEAGL